MNRFTLTLAASASLFAATNPSYAQTAAPTIAPPALPLMVTYRYWPVQFVQWVGPELPYTMIELDVDPGAGKHPLLYVTLTERATGKRIHYTDNDVLVASATGQGEEAHKTAIGYEAADTEAVGSISTVRFTMADGKALQWRFVQGSDISEQGSGLTPLPDSKIPILAYRELAAVAGEGTALQIGPTVSTASVWTEISQPPYFVAYRGAESQSAHILVFTAGQENWTVSSAPAALTAGATWELDEAHGDHRSLRIEKVDGAHLAVTATDRFQPGVQCGYDAVRMGDSWSFDHVRFAPVKNGDKHFLALQFATPLGANGTALTLLAGKKKTIANGTLTVSGAPADRTLTLSFTNPAWLNGKVLTEQHRFGPEGMVVFAHP